MLDAEKQVASNVALLGNEQKAVPLAETLIKDLAYALAKLFDSSSPLLEKNLNQISNLKDMFRSEFLSILGRAINEANREPFEKNILMDIFGKIQIALKQLPEDLRNNVSKLFVGSVVEDTNVIAKAIFGEFGVDGNNLAKGFGKDFFQEANNKFASTKLLQILENMPISIKKEIAFALSGSQGAKPGDIAELLINKINGSNIGVDFSPKLELTSPSIRQIITIMLEVARPIINRHFSDLSSTAGDGSLVVNERMVSQKLTQVIENMPISIRKDTAAVVLGNSEAGAKDISENIYHRAVGSASSNIEKGVFQNTQPEIRQIITLLHELAMSFQLEGDRLLGVTAEVNNGGQITASDFQKVVQAIENLPASIRRAIALAIFNSPETKPIDIATFIINQGANANIDKNLVSLLESTPPLVRQLVTVISQLPIGSTPQQIAESVLNGERGIFLAAKGILSVDAGVEKSNLSDLSGLGSVLNNDDASRNNSTESTSGLSNSNINEKLLSITFADRISYLLRFEHFNSQQTFSMGEKNDISSWFRSIVDQLILTKSTKMQYQEVADSFKQNRESLRIDRNTNSIVGQAANKTIEPPLDKPQTWQAWLKGSMKALVDQSISPKDALFHTIVAREGVNYFQLPLPWLSNRSMEMWIEEEEANEAENKNPSTFRMLLAVNFSILGETRIGMESSGKRLAVKIWTESPHLIEKELPNLQSGIAALGFDVHASIQTLGSDKEGVIPSIKSIIMGSSLHAMG
ncbi:MAG: hypothetical protein FWG02_05620 [Holophagaceae bacterium]|nr:hypothetical protein [Holophagaceae bacterium]